MGDYAHKRIAGQFFQRGSHHVKRVRAESAEPLVYKEEVVVLVFAQFPRYCYRKRQRRQKSFSARQRFYAAALVTRKKIHDEKFAAFFVVNQPVFSQRKVRKLVRSRCGKLLDVFRRDKFRKGVFIENARQHRKFFRFTVITRLLGNKLLFAA